jgi:SAM-dependent methyltransferase
MKIPVVTASDEGGCIDYADIWLEKSDHVYSEQIEGIIDIKGDFILQLKAARQLVESFIALDWVKPLIVNDLTKGNLVVKFDDTGLQDSEKNRYGGSGGLSFLIGCLATCFDVYPKDEYVYSAALAPFEQADLKNISLQSVGDVEQKIKAANEKRKNLIFLYSEDEDESQTAEEFALNYWAVNAEYSCFPFMLPRELSIIAIINMALDTENLSKKAVEQNAYKFIWILLSCGFELQDGKSFPRGIGPITATLRTEGKLGKDEETQIRGVISDNVEKWSSYVDDSLKEEIVKTVISSNPDLEVYPRDYSNVKPAAKVVETTDVVYWLENYHISTAYDLIFSLTILKGIKQLPFDWQAYFPFISSMIRLGLETILDKSVNDLYGSPQLTASVPQILVEENLGKYLGQIDTRLIEQAKTLVYSYLKKNHLEEIKQLYDHLVIYDDVEILVSKQDDSLKLTFRRLDYFDDNIPKSDERPPLPRINELALDIQQGTDDNNQGTNDYQLHLFIPSPVLLMESSLRQHENYCRRHKMAFSDDTLSRYPMEDASRAYDMFASVSSPTVISFQFKNGSKASVVWNPIINAWPPAIDSQFLISELIRSGKQSSPKCLLDVGCGTGYLSVAAAHVWQTLQEIHLLDIDVLSLSATEINLTNDAITRPLKKVFHAVSLHRFFSLLPRFKTEKQPFDVILCSPPYLPNRPVMVEGIEISTNNTGLLEELVTHGPRLSKEIWLVFSVLAWPEFKRALFKAAFAYKEVEVLKRTFVPFRIPWLEPDPEQSDFERKRDYYEKTLKPRGLIDMDDSPWWNHYQSKFAPELLKEDFELCIQDGLEAQQQPIADLLEKIKQDSRGYRFWHEIRVVRLTTKAQGSAL